MLSQDFRNSIQGLSFWPSFIGISLFISLGVFFTGQLGAFLNGALDIISGEGSEELMTIN